MTLARSLGGYVGEVQYSTHAGKRGGARVVLRVPVGSVQAALTTLTGLGTILQQQTGILDVTRRADRESRQIAKLQAAARDARARSKAPAIRAHLRTLAGEAPAAAPEREPRADRADPDDAGEPGGRGAESPPPHARRRRRRAPARAPVPALRADRRGPAAPARRRRRRDRSRCTQAFGPKAARARLVDDAEARLRDDARAPGSTTTSAASSPSSGSRGRGRGSTRCPASAAGSPRCPR